MIEKFKIHVIGNFKAALARVRLSFTAFLPFLFALLLVQGVLSTTLLFYHNNFNNEKALIEEEYDFHLQISGLSEYQMLKLEQILFPVTTNSAIAERVRVIKHDPDPSVAGNEVYDSYYRLLTGNKERGFLDFAPDTLRSNYEDFFSKTAATIYKEPGSVAEITRSPLYELQARETAVKIEAAIVCLLLGGISVLILWALSSMRINQFRFTYGMYAAFGATTRKLQGIAFFELLVCQLITLLPASLLAYLLSSSIYAAGGQRFAFYLPAFLWAALLTLAVTLISVCPSMRRLASKQPAQLLQAEDHSNLVSPPRRSILLTKKRFPRHYEGITAFRMRKYHIRLALTSAILCTAFIAGLYTVSVYNQERKIGALTTPDFTFTFHEQTYIGEDVADKFRATENVAKVHKSYSSRSASSLKTHLLMTAENAGSASFVTYPFDSSYKVTSDVQYMCAMDEDLPAMLSETYTVEGDPTEILDDPYAVVIGAGYRNRDVLDVKVGDTVYVAVIKPPSEDDILLPGLDENGNPIETEAPETNDPLQDFDALLHAMAGKDALLAEQIRTMEFEYRPMRVAAVVYQYPSATNGIPLVMNTTAYESLTGDTATSNTLYVTAKDGLSGNELSVLEGTMRHYTYLFDNTDCVAHGTHFKETITEMSHYDELFTVFAWFAVLFVPIIWFYSHILFYRKRKRELAILQTLGADMKAIKRLHLTSLAVMVPITLFSLLLSTCTTYLFYVFSTYTMPLLFSQGSAVVSVFSMNPFPYAVSFLLTFISCLTSAYTPYLLYRREMKKSAHNLAVSD